MKIVIEFLNCFYNLSIKNINIMEGGRILLVSNVE